MVMKIFKKMAPKNDERISKKNEIDEKMMKEKEICFF